MLLFRESNKKNSSSLLAKLLMYSIIISIVGSCDLFEKIKGDSKNSDPPVLPDLELLQPDIDFFAIQSKKAATEDTSAYELASHLVSTDFTPFVQSIYTYLPFLNDAKQTEPESTDQGWEWNYSHNRQGQDYNIRLITERREDTRVYYAWTLFISTSTEDTDTLNNYKFMELSTREDESGGYWIVYPPELRNADMTDELIPYLSLSWEFYNENNEEYYYDYNPYTPNSNEQIVAEFIRDFNSNFEYDSSINMFKENAEFEEKVFYISWNSNTKGGFVILENDYQSGYVGITRCWDEKLNDIECQI